ncbi:MAG: dihydrofolate reductase [Muribaculaceae bacterium]|nr:dihydrofolate reductase [Muribaculaceae bacterium]
MITIIAVVGPGNCLGSEGRLLYSLRDDMRHFKELTMGHPVIMGRKTFETLPRPLDGRTNIVITRQADYAAPAGVIVVNSLDEALNRATDSPGGDNCFIIGGGEIYRMAIPGSTDIQLTRVDAAPSLVPDTFFPDIDPAEWHEVSATPMTLDSRSALPYRFIHLTRQSQQP